MKKMLLSLSGVLIISTLAIAQVTQEDYILLADASTVNNWLGWDNNYGDGGLVTVSLSSNNAILMNFNLPNPNWYPFIGTYWFDAVNGSMHPKIIAKVKLPAATTGFGVELKCITQAGGDTLGLNGPASSNSLPRFDAFVGTGDWQYFEYTIGTWESSYPTLGIVLDPAQVIGLNFFYGYNATTTPLVGEMEAMWIAIAKDGISAADLDAFITTGVSETNQAIDFNVSPNPSNDGYFEVSSKSIINTIEIFNLVGQRVYTKLEVNNSNSSITLTSLAKGVYLLKCDNTTQKIIIK